MEKWIEAVLVEASLQALFCLAANGNGTLDDRRKVLAINRFLDFQIGRSLFRALPDDAA